MCRKESWGVNRCANGSPFHTMSMISVKAEFRSSFNIFLLQERRRHPPLNNVGMKCRYMYVLQVFSRLTYQPRIGIIRLLQALFNIVGLRPIYIMSALFSLSYF